MSYYIVIFKSEKENPTLQDAADSLGCSIKDLSTDIGVTPWDVPGEFIAGLSDSAIDISDTTAHELNLIKV